MGWLSSTSPQGCEASPKHTLRLAKHCILLRQIVRPVYARINALFDAESYVRGISICHRRSDRQN